MKILFDSEEIKELCSGCNSYCTHYTAKSDEGPAFKCQVCGRLTIWKGGDTERVVTIGIPPAGV